MTEPPADSILVNTKKALSIDTSYIVFDQDIIMHINSVFSILNQLGLGPDNGFMIEDALAVWSDFIGSNLKLNLVKSYLYLKVRLLFDPPATSFALDTMKQQIQEFEWRLNVTRESVSWVDPNPPPPDVDICEDVDSLTFDLVEPI